MSYSLSLFAGAGWQFFDNNGTILSGGKLYTYSAGSTTPLDTYTSSTATALNPNPIILDSAGRVPAEVWVNSSSIAKFVLKDADNVLIGTWDNIPSLISSLNLTGVNNGVVYFNSVGTFTSGTNLTFDGANLGVAGAATIGSNLNVAGPSALTGNVTANGTLSVTGTTTLSGNASVGGTLSVTGNVINTLNVTGTLTTSGTTTLATGSTLTTSPAATDSSTKIATTAFFTAASLGYNQTWIPCVIATVQQTGYNRIAGTTYTNDTGKPIMVNISGSLGDSVVIYAGATTPTIVVSEAAGYVSGSIGSRANASAIIPPGWTYKSNSLTIYYWTELR